MNTALPIIGLLASTVMAALGQDAGSAPATASPAVSYFVGKRSANQQTWYAVTGATNGASETNLSTSIAYVELASGLNYWDDSSNAYVPSAEEVDGYPGGAIAARAQHKVIFANDPNTSLAIDMQTPDGKRLQSHVLGLAYYDWASGSNVMIAVVKDCQGVISDGNQVVYQNAFTDLKANLVYQFTRGGFEQLVLLEQRPALPEKYGLSTATSELQVWTEFLSPPTPMVRARTIQAWGSGEFPDQNLDFGAMRIGQGKAFVLGQDPLEGVPVAKEWATLQGRTFLIESIPIAAIAAQLDRLPEQASLNAAPGSVGRTASIKRFIPTAPPQAESGTNKMKLASVQLPTQGLLLDYQMLNSSLTNYVFKGDTTYYISGNVNLYGTSNVLEGGSVLKYATNVSLTCYGSLDCRTGPYHPAVCTAKDDNSLGETISGSSGSPSGHYASSALLFSQPTSAVQLHDIRVLYASTGVSIASSSTLTHELADSQLGNVSYGVNCYYGSTLKLQNLLIYQATSGALSAYATTYRAEHLTVDQANKVLSSGTLYLTNSLLVSITNSGTGYTTVNNATNSSSSVFQTVEGGQHYLADDSQYRNAGTTNIDATLLADLRTKTTYPPIAYTNVTFTNALTLSPQAQRDTDTPDLGYHYDPLDWVCGGCTVNSNLTCTAGTALAWFRTSSGWGPYGYGIHMADDTTARFEGRADTPVYWVRCNTVQEQDLTAGYGRGGLQSWCGTYTTGTLADAVQVVGNFLRCSEIVDNGTYFQGSGHITVYVTDCEFHSGSIGGYNPLCYYTNCLFDRANLWLDNSNPSFPLLFARNCLFHGGSVWISHRGGSNWYSSIRDCVFDSTANTIEENSGGSPLYVDYDYNSMQVNNSTNLHLQGTNDVFWTNYNWQSSWFGDYYLPTNSPLINAGSRNADLAGLYHFTTQTNQVKETNSVVDISYHYVAADSNGNPADADGDGNPDYLEDLNGNGAVDSGETDWQSASDLGLKVWITQPKDNSIIP